MKKLTALFIFLLMTSGLFAQQNRFELQQERKKVYQQYKSFRDTMTIRTWINMVELSNRLEAVVNVDNQLLDSLPPQRTSSNSNLQNRLRELTTQKDQLINENARLNTQLADYNKQKNTYIFIVVLSVIIILVLGFSWFSYMSKFKKLEKRRDQSGAKILELKQLHKKETDELKQEIEKLTEDKEMMENNASQMKKSFEVLKSENEAKTQTQSETNEDVIVEIRKEMEALSSEVSGIIEEKQKLEEELIQTREELDKHKNASQSIEGELENLLKKFKKD